MRHERFNHQCPIQVRETVDRVQWVVFESDVQPSPPASLQSERAAGTKKTSLFIKIHQSFEFFIADFIERHIVFLISTGKR
jgi:hypothetical protein